MAWLWKRFHVLSFVILLFGQAGFAAAEIKFEKQSLKVGNKKIEVEIAKSHEQLEHGLMFRKNMPEDHGMLFIFENEDYRYFWMKNTYIDLSIAYIDASKTIVDIQEMLATSVMESRPPSYPSAKPAQYALEMNKGWFKRNKVKVGDKFEFLKR